jgi:glycosyltransferase involved in cell wall biosynthesis
MMTSPRSSTLESDHIRVAFNGTALLSPLTGVGQYAKCLAERLISNEFLDLHFFYAATWSRHIITEPVREIGAIKELIKKCVPQPYRVSRALQQWRFGLGTRRLRPHLYHEPNFLPFRFDGPTVITAHDLSWIRYPETHPRERVAVMNKLFPRSLEWASHILTDAAYVRKEIIQEFGVKPERITAVPLGARLIFRPRSQAECAVTLDEHDLSYRRYVLCVGTLEPRKNLELAIRAYAALPPAFRERYPLVTVGMKGWLTSKLESVMQPLVASGELRPLGYTSDESLASLYAGAMVLVYPSLYEGFGLPPLEAMASGTPVIVSNRSTLPEVVGDAGVIIDAEDELGLRQTLLRLIEDPGFWNERVSASLKQAERFSWQRCADQTLAIYRKVLAES